MNGLTEKGSTIDTLRTMGQWKFLGSDTVTDFSSWVSDDIRMNFSFDIDITPSTFPVLLVGIKYISGRAASNSIENMYIQDERNGVIIAVNGYIENSNITYYGMLRGIEEGYISMGATNYSSVQAGLFVTLPSNDGNITTTNYTLQMSVYGFVAPES